VAHEFGDQQSKYSATNDWQGAALVTLVVRLLGANAQICVTTYSRRESDKGVRSYLSVDTITSTLGTRIHPRQQRVSFQSLISLLGASGEYRGVFDIALYGLYVVTRTGI
jgi:hypothetical protein